jgi:hypothetical protein
MVAKEVIGASAGPDLGMCKRYSCPNKKGAQMKGPMQWRTPTRGPPDKRASMHWVRAPLSGGPLKYNHIK